MTENSDNPRGSKIARLRSLLHVRGRRVEEKRAGNPTNGPSPMPQVVPEPLSPMEQQQREFETAVRALDKSLCPQCVNLLTILTPATQHLTCRLQFKEDPTLPTMKGLYIAISYDSESSLNPCRLCARFGQPMDGYYEQRRCKGEAYGYLERYGYKGHIVELNSFRLYRHIYGATNLEKNSFRVYAEYGDLVASNVLGRPVRNHGGDLRTLELAQDWVDDCVKNHLECRSPEAKGEKLPKLPTRVIDVGGSEGDSIRLLCPDGKRGEWAALSHCWGKESFLTAMTSNIAALQSQIDLSSLPLTFRDAITVTKQLGIRYLWIDSLCILQDLPKDWQAEAACMPNIYRNARAVIAAAATDSSPKGFLGEREWTASSNPCEIRVPSGGKVGKVNFDDNFFGDYAGDNNNTLVHRAWCFQEINLSHRLVTFDKLQMSFTCLRHGLFEFRDSEDPVRREERNLFLERFQEPLAENDERRARQLVNTWYDLLADYTKRSLTYPNDKLVAISGISNIVGQCFQSDYYAGLWQKFLPQALLWSPYDEETLPFPPHIATRPPSYRAPSWSWAAVESPISCFICRESFIKKPLSEVLKIETTLVGPDKYGQVSNGYIIIKGPIRKASPGPCLEEWPSQPRVVWPKEAGCYSDDKSHCVFDADPLTEGAEMWCLQITEVYGLILEMCAGSQETYSRRGIFHLRTHKGEGNASKHFSTPPDVKTVKIV